MSDKYTELKSAGVQFLDTHEKVVSDLATAEFKITDHERTIDGLNALVTTQRQQIDTLTRDKNTYLQYAFELSAQLHFIVAGAARALKTADNVRLRMEQQGTKAVDVSEKDVADLTELLGRLGVQTSTEPPTPEMQTVADEMSRHIAESVKGTAQEKPQFTQPPSQQTLKAVK